MNWKCVSTPRRKLEYLKGDVLEIERKKLKVDRFDDIWIPIPAEFSKDLYREMEEAYNWVWELVKKVNRREK